LTGISWGLKEIKSINFSVTWGNIGGYKRIDGSKGFEGLGDKFP